MVCGEVGAGKTVAARASAAALGSSRYTIIYLPNPAVGARGIYTQIVSALGSTPRFYRATLIPQATDLLAAETAERGKIVVLILDLSDRRRHIRTDRAGSRCLREIAAGAVRIITGS